MPRVIANLTSVFKAGYRSSAFSPLVWLFTIVVFACILIMLFTDNNTIDVIMTCTVVGLLLFIGIMYVALFKKDPKLLQSETFRLEDKKLDLIADKDRGINVLPVELTTPTKGITQGNRAKNE